MPLRVRALDHLVLTVADIEATVAFYEALGMTRVRFGEGRVALAFGGQKINLHPAGAEIAPHAAHPRPGSADLCFLVEGDVADLSAHLSAAGLAVELGPGQRTEHEGQWSSAVLRDPAGNLCSISAPDGPGSSARRGQPPPSPAGEFPACRYAGKMRPARLRPQGRRRGRR